MRNLIYTGVLSLGLIMMPAFGADPDKAKDEYDAAGQKIEKGAKRSGKAIKHGEVTASGKELGKGIGSGTKHAAKGTAEGAKVAAEKTGDAAETAAHKTKRGAKKAGHAVKDSLDGKDEQQPQK